MVPGPFWHTLWCPGFFVFLFFYSSDRREYLATFPFSWEKIYMCNFRVTAMATPTNIYSGVPFVLTNSSMVIEFAIYMKISAKLFSAKSYGGRVCGPWLFYAIDTSDGPRDYRKDGDIISYCQQRLQIQWRQRGASVLAHTRTRWWRQRCILTMSVPAGNTKRIPRRRRNQQCCWPSGQRWRRLSRHHCHTIVKRENAFLCVRTLGLFLKLYLTCNRLLPDYHKTLVKSAIER